MLFVRYPKSEPDKITIDFDYPYKLDKFKRFSFLRSKSEQLSVFLYRLKTKMNIELEKSLKKKKISGEDISSMLVGNTTVINKNTDLTCDFFNMSLKDVLIDNSILQIDDYEYDVVINSPIIHLIKLPKVLLTECPIIPIVSMEYGGITDLNFEWHISQNKIKWEKISSELIFTAEPNHIYHFLKLKCICPKTNQFMEKISENIITECPKQTAIEARWKYTAAYIDDHNKFRVVSYNLLADIYSDSSTARDQIFRHCPTEFLNMDYRKGLLMKEISHYHSDIICLQEVDLNMFTDFLHPHFSTDGFDDLFQPKDIDSTEGQAIFWRRSKFKLIENISIKSISKLVFHEEMLNFEPIRHLIRKSSDLLQQWIQLKQCMAGCVIQSIDDSHRVIVINTHLYFRPEAEVCRSLQIATILIFIESLKHQYPDSKVVIAGDFNSPRNSSTIKLILNGSVSLDDILSDDLAITLRHGLPFQSACHTIFTNYTLDFASELDYIFYESGGLLCERSVPFPSLSEITAEQALPNKYFPSDHLALIADFVFKD